MTRTIPATQGRHFICDEVDYEKLSAFTWHTRGPRSHQRAARVVRESGRQIVIFAHHDVIGKPPKGMVVDHINSDPLDNRRENLRFCTQADNVCNKRAQVKESGAGKGVTRAGCRWMAQIHRARKRYYLGIYDTMREAELAYDAAALYVHGEFARLNHPDAGTKPRHPAEIWQSTPRARRAAWKVALPHPGIAMGEGRG